MKTYFSSIIAIICLLQFATNGVAQTAEPKAAEATVRKLERAWLDAYEQHDAKAMEEIVADGFVITFPGGQKQTKAQLMESMRKPRPAGESSKFRTEETQARVFGETVVLTGRVVEESQREGKSRTEQMLYTDTYVRRSGVWQVVASHLGSVPDSRPKSQKP